ncbi:MAG TPA: DUF465 domain-containing protein [Polyangiaceae bacterium LLY-WYZ-15_(1-7)]|nr:DUF465 domain-containing protein [Polyangiaceae bacterium LLY-WYZ-15_(1-7)]
MSPRRQSMARTRRSSDPEFLMSRLEKKHSKLDSRVSELTERPYLTPAEQMEARRLKKKKLELKDQLRQMRSD